ncbi:hypothetical protein GC096_07465 [Paenibacillus sp. LMG 31461]|uniref:Chemotaxis phosphatase CheX-like domain-containing protein n=1 Tax=Paenibacillus plantarum TaxID=2654975 RepID=A0ABX1X782_9BACL|nr:chemotaxis protein CheX [Paenibacillus plantarum]NOU63860.1 hypothetical protein [Paenibacillus plantarum]
MTQNLQNLLLDSVRVSIGNMLPQSLDQTEVSISNEPIRKDEIGVSINFTNSEYCMILDGQRVVFSRMSEAIFGMYMEGEMLDSCVSEIANIIAGRTTTILGEQGVALDITPPSLLEENYHCDNQANKLMLPISIQTVGDIRVVLLKES